MINLANTQKDSMVAMGQGMENIWESNWYISNISNIMGGWESKMLFQITLESVCIYTLYILYIRNEWYLWEPKQKYLTSTSFSKHCLCGTSYMVYTMYFVA